MPKDPICGMEGTIPFGKYYFCSDNCVKKFKKGIKTPWYKERLYLILIITLLVVSVSYFVSFLNPFFDAFIDYFKLIWWAVLLGLLIGGLIDRFVPREYVSKYLAQNKKRTIFYATFLGFIMSACSHGILAISIELYKKGASVPAIIAFLLAAPWANIVITVLLFSFFGFKAIFLIVAAIIIAITTGFIFQLLDKKNLIEKAKSAKVDEKFSVWKDIKKRKKAYAFSFNALLNDSKGVLHGSWTLSKMVLWWILIGMLLASAARAFIPVHIFHQFLGPTLLGIAITLIIATIIEVCSEGSSPIAFEIYNQTGALGNSFVFLMSGVTTDMTEIGLIWSNIGKKAAIWLPIVTIPQIVLVGFLFNMFL
ncbi:hypothetical protein CMO88_04535 [Candidatus Woesearchaeota archaeon]|mgnify:CR=1 FL=1|nr:hypothetical protein [Candidatus Woesearchaeota archaeon]|tara:strand:- start:4449 stop:5546 length:1098 start_codon:yes stop_codon:yes gene_type:complete